MNTEELIHEMNVLCKLHPDQVVGVLNYMLGQACVKSDYKGMVFLLVLVKYIRGNCSEGYLENIENTLTKKINDNIAEIKKLDIQFNFENEEIAEIAKNI